MDQKKKIIKNILTTSLALGIAFANVAGIILGKKPQAFSALHQTLNKPTEENKFKVD